MIGRVRNAGQDRLYPPAHILGEGAAWVEAAARRWIDRCRRIARQGRRLLATVDVHLRYRRQQCSGVGVLRRPVKDVYGPELDDLTQIHHRSAEHTTELQSPKRTSYAVF